MPVFNAYFKVIKKNLASISIYFFVFMGMAVLFLNLGGSQASPDFSSTKTNVVLFTEEETPLVAGLKELLTENARIIPLADSDESVQDALFFGKADYILRIPVGFTDSFLSGNDTVLLQKTARPMSPGAVSVDLIIGKYLNLTRLYLHNLPDITGEKAAENVLRDLRVSAEVEMKTNAVKIKTTGLTDSFRYLAYPILAILIMGITTAIMAFNSAEISRRNLCAPLSPSKMSLQLFSGNAVFAAAVWALLCAIALALFSREGFNIGVLLLCLNALVFTVFCAAAAFLTGKLIRSPVVQAA
ncbi:MAG: ABC transporter permease, partial [Clostridiales bacterium]|nr:ABC transporter permease [Clostridiales bacterium]